MRCCGNLEQPAQAMDVALLSVTTMNDDIIYLRKSGEENLEMKWTRTQIKTLKQTIILLYKP